MAPVLPHYHRLQVKEIIAETSDAKSFELLPMDGWQPAWQSGQFLTLIFQKQNSEDRRSYSISSSPALNEPLCITVKRVTNGEYSRQLFDLAKPGDILYSSGISGFFQLPENRAQFKNYFFLAAGSGISPVYSLLKTLLTTTDLPATLVYSNFNIDSTIFYQQLQDLQKKYPGRLNIEFLFSELHHVRKSRLSKWLFTSLLEQFQTPLQDTLFYLCGPSGYMLMAGISLITAGVPARNIRKEIFISPKLGHHTAVPPDTNPHQVEIHLGNQVYHIRQQYPDTILAAAKKQQIPLPYSCETGFCGTCAATCTSGRIWMANNEVLMDDEITKGKVLTCQGFAIGGDAILSLGYPV